MAPVFDQFVDWVSGSSWSYVAIFAVGFSMRSSRSSRARPRSSPAGSSRAGRPVAAPVIVAASTGAFIGDNISYWIGAWAGQHTVKRAFRGERSRRAFLWAEEQLEERGFYLIIIARFIPGGRTAVTFLGYTQGMPYRRFVVADAIAAVIWGS